MHAPADRERARQCVLDWICAAVAGAQEPAARMAQQVALAEGRAASSLLGTPVRSGPQQAALANGVAAHSLELDDVARWMTGHPGASICSAVLALAEARAHSGRDVLDAVIAGYDAACRIGLTLGPGHGAAGWHATGTIGTLAAALACAQLIGLDEEARAHALGLAATQAGGLKASIGTMGKALNAGRAAANGIAASLLAERGFSGPARALECFAEATTTTFDVRRADEVMGGAPGIRSVVFKRYACCGLAIPLADAIRRLIEEEDVDVGSVAHVAVRVPGHTLAICAIDDPATALESKFSLSFVAAAALADRVGGLGAFTEEGVRDPRLAALRACVSVAVHAGPDPSTAVEVRLTSGRTLQRTELPETPVADAGLARQRELLVTRFEDVCTPLLGAEACSRVSELTAQLDGPGAVGPLLAAACPG